MPDQNQNSPTVEQRLAAVVESLKQRIKNRAQFRPDDKDLAEAYDAETAALVDALEQASSAAAVDERALILATDMSVRRNARMLAEQKMRGDYDAALLTAGGQFALPFLAAASGVRS